MDKALAAAHDSAQHCLQAAADALALKMPADGVMCSSLWRRSGRKPVTVLVLWPCWVLEVQPGTGAVIAETHIAELQAKRPQTAAFLQRTAESGPAKSMFLCPPQSRRQRVTVDALCVVRVHDAKTGELRAESEPGQPGVLRVGFEPLTPADLAPRLT
ncbi:hypothetical protein C8C94_4864 [Acidovorax sp. 94]|uniref:hypothetical protein n=1 Tax=unclassified Acidovorax TaxID=2684926 RepID=UPI000EAE94AD|nr:MULTISPECIES: hypothetical protein [unclassified Acidovorax]MBV7458785.1 hypothetical protein [Acidovorax sp. sif0632]MBV7463393.1 hypothetical protein [Acidovorax sp. sif0613]RKR70317.1 hypothetical protein C8C94_4864 [Acidovorax sp. 94]